MQLFVVYRRENPGEKLLIWAEGREQVKRKAKSYLLGNPDWYVVTPITNPGDTVINWQ